MMEGARTNDASGRREDGGGEVGGWVLGRTKHSREEGGEQGGEWENYLRQKEQSRRDEKAKTVSMQMQVGVGETMEPITMM
jgi:hypothetical protein